MAWVRCPSCSFAQADSLFLNNESAACRACHKVMHTRLLPSLYKKATPPPMLSEAPPEAGETVCFYNPERRATKSCDHCGVFISEPWAAVWGRKTVCLKCLEDLRTKGGDQQFESQRRLWDNMALGFALGPWVVGCLLVMTLILYPFGFMVFMVSIITAPAGLYMALRYWNAPRSLVPRGKGRLVAAVILSSLQIILWAISIATFINEVWFSNN